MNKFCSWNREKTTKMFIYFYFFVGGGERPQLQSFGLIVFLRHIIIGLESNLKKKSWLLLPLEGTLLKF